MEQKGTKTTLLGGSRTALPNGTSGPSIQDPELPLQLSDFLFDGLPGEDRAAVVGGSSAPN